MKQKENTKTLCGSCLCGQVEYSLIADIEDFYLCHCQQCRKITGSAFASNIVAKPTEVEWLSGKDQIKHFDHPTRQFTKVFCTNCGSGLPYININKTALVIPAGSLNIDPEINPTKNIFWDDKALWYVPAINAPKCSGFPE